MLGAYHHFGGAQLALGGGALAVAEQATHVHGELGLRRGEPLPHAVGAQADSVAGGQGVLAVLQGGGGAHDLHGGLAGLPRGVHQEDLVGEELLAVGQHRFIRPRVETQRGEVLVALLPEAGLVTLLIEGGGAAIPLDAGIGRIARFGLAHGAIGMVAEVHAGMSADAPGTITEDLLAAAVVGGGEAEAVGRVHPFLRAHFARGVEVQQHGAGVRAQFLAADLGHGGQGEQGEEEREGAHGGVLRGTHEPNIGPSCNFARS